MNKWVLLGIAGAVAAVLGLAFYAIAKDARQRGWPELRVVTE